MKYKHIPVGMFETNCYLVLCGNVLYIIDPGDDAERIKAAANEFEYDIVRILLTHTHIDHISAIPELMTEMNVESVYMHENEYIVYSSKENSIPPWYPAAEGLPEPVFTPWDDFTVLSTPGHTPGGVCYYFADNNLIFTGDTLFADSIGRTDLAGGNHKQLIDSIHNVLMKFDDSVLCLPGHGPATTIGDERYNNPYL